MIYFTSHLKNTSNAQSRRCEPLQNVLLIPPIIWRNCAFSSARALPLDAIYIVEKTGKELRG